ncbi:EamA family transporter, partial [Micromonospora azadirachtae]
MTSTPSRPSRVGNRPGRPATAAPALVWTALLLVYLLWGSTYLGIRIAVETMPALASAAARFAVAA